jgi:hypothetical protein
MSSVGAGSRPKRCKTEWRRAGTRTGRGESGIGPPASPGSGGGVDEGVGMGGVGVGV